MKLLLFNLFFFLIFINNLFSYENLLFEPLTANPLEGRIGSIIQTNQDNLRLDIGASFDLIEFNPSLESKIRLGADFFTYTRLRSEKNFKFPVETSDYFFGINGSYKGSIWNIPISSRLRLAHISAHLVDGYSKDGNFWKLPFVYSREFADFTLAFDSLLKSEILPNGIRFYLGHNFVFSNSPEDAESMISNIGFDIKYPLIDFIYLQLGIDYKTSLSNSNYYQFAGQAGVYFETSSNKGIFVGYYNFNGYSLHGLFYNEKDNYSGIGFQIFYH